MEAETGSCDLLNGKDFLGHVDTSHDPTIISVPETGEWGGVAWVKLGCNSNVKA